MLYYFFSLFDENACRNLWNYFCTIYFLLSKAGFRSIVCLKCYNVRWLFSLNDKRNGFVFLRIFFGNIFGFDWRIRLSSATDSNHLGWSSAMFCWKMKLKPSAKPLYTFSLTHTHHARISLNLNRCAFHPSWITG